MTLEDACYSLKLECALRELGFVDIGWRVVAHAGIFFVEPVGWSTVCGPEDDLFGFQLQRHVMAKETDRRGLHLGRPIAQTARKALDLAISLS
jgi:hypothetical protein